MSMDVLYERRKGKTVVLALRFTPWDTAHCFYCHKVVADTKMQGQNLGLTLTSDLWLLAILDRHVTAFSKSNWHAHSPCSNKELCILECGSQGEWGILHDLTASSTGMALSACMFAHMKQVWASLLSGQHVKSLHVRLNHCTDQHHSLFWSDKS